MDDNGKTFLQDVTNFANQSPPGFSLPVGNISGNLMIQEVQFKVQVLEALYNKDSRLLSSFSGQIVRMLRTNARFLPISSLLTISSLLLKVNRKLALQFGKEVIILTGKGNLDMDTCIILHILFYPTIIDAEAASLVHHVPAITQHTIDSKSACDSPRKMPPLDVREMAPTIQPNTHRSAGNRESNEITFDKNDDLMSELTGKAVIELRQSLGSLEKAIEMLDLELYYQYPKIPCNDFVVCWRKQTSWKIGKRCFSKGWPIKRSRQAHYWHSLGFS